MIRVLCVGALLTVACAMADDSDLRSKLAGSWQLQASGAKEASSYTLEPVADGIHISASEGGKTVSEFQCKLAEDCKIKDAGHQAKVMIYYNGPKLVETETIGSRVIKKRYTVTGDGNTMEVETIPIEPEGKAETVVFKRAATEAAKQ